MAYSGYQHGPAYVEDSRFPVFVAGPSNEWHYGNAPASQSFEHTSMQMQMPIPQTSPLEPPRSPWRVDVNSTAAPSTGFMPPVYGSGPATGQNRHFHVVTDTLSGNHGNIWPGGPGESFVQSPSSYCSPPPPPPNPQGVPSTPWHKIIDIKLEEGNYMPVNLTRCLDGREIRKVIISRLLNINEPSVSRFEIFHDSPPGPKPNVALSDQQLMLEVGHFGDAERTLKLSVQAMEVTSNRYLPRDTWMPTATLSPVSTHPLNSYYNQVDPSSSGNPRSSVFGYHGPVTNGPPSNSYSTNSSSYISAPPLSSIPMPTPMPMSIPVSYNGHGYRTAPGFSTPGYSPRPVSPGLRGPSVCDFTGQSSYAGPPESSVAPNAVLTDDCLGQGLGGFGNTDSDENSNEWKSGDYRHITSVGGEGSRPGSVVISDTMTIEEILPHLYVRGCQNLTGQLNESTFSRNPAASGGAGDVYSGSLYTGQRVGVKCIRMTNKDMCDEEQSKLKKTAHELYVWSKCRHPNVLELIGVTQYRDRIAMVSPWMDNGDLRRFLCSYPQTDRYDLCVQMANGVAYLHSEEIVHGDIKGANVLISKDCVLKIADFGTSSLKEYTLAFATTGKKPGMTIRWTAPEIIEDKSVNSEAADVYALGMTMLEAMTGKIPYVETANDVAAMQKITQGIHPPRPNTHIPESCRRACFLWSLLKACWNRDPQMRPNAALILDQVRTIKN